MMTYQSPDKLELLQAAVLAAEQKDKDTLQSLLRNSVDIDDVVFHAIDRGSDRSLECLQEVGASFNVENCAGQTVLTYAALLGMHECMHVLARLGADVNMISMYGGTPLTFVCSDIDDFTTEAQILIEEGADVERPDEDGCRPVIAACENKKFDILRLLVNAGADINCADQHGVTPLMHCVENQDTQCVKLLTQNYVDTDIQDGRGQTALMWAIDRRKCDTIAPIVSLLLEADTGVDGADNYAWTALMYAAKRNHSECIEQLISHHADINVVDRDGKSALMIAAEHERVESLMVLCQHGADPNIQDVYNMTALMHALHNNRGLKMVLPLLQLGSNLNLADTDGDTALLYALRHDDVVSVENIMHAGASIQVQNDFGETPLILAISQNQCQLAKEFIKKRCRRSAPCVNGGTWLDDTVRTSMMRDALSATFTPSSSEELTELLIGSGEQFPVQLVGAPHDILSHGQSTKFDTLQDLARHVVREHLKSVSVENLISQVDRLPLPNGIKGFLCFLSKPFEM